MPKPSKSKTTTLHEVYTSLANFEKRLVCHIDADEWERLVSVFEREYEAPPSFYGFELVDGLDCYVNLAHVTKLNILDYLAGLPFEKPPEKSDAEWATKIEERDASNDPVFLRVWGVTDRTIETYGDIDYGEWTLIRHALEENDQRFIGFTDEDGERVILATAHIGAVQVFDTHYLTDEELDRLLKSEEEVA